MIDFSSIPREEEKPGDQQAQPEGPAGEQEKEQTSSIDFFSVDHSADRPAGPPPQEQPVEGPPPAEPAQAEARPAQAQKAKPPAPDPQGVEDLYRVAAVLAERIMHNTKDLTPANVEQIRHLVQDLIGYIENGNRHLFERLFEHLPGTVDPLSLNLVNVCILSLDVGIALGYEPSQLADLGVAAFLHDVGMGKHHEIVSQARQLGPEEKAAIRDHTRGGSDSLRAIHDNIQESVLRVVREEHERDDGSGYPRGLENGGISEQARIIGMVDVYEALTHDRPYRKKHSPIEAVKIMAENKNLFDVKLMKAFLEKIGFYPKGTFVQLNTKEVARVLAQNLKMPLSPVVEVIYDEQGKKVEGGREIDLSNGTRNFITRSI